MGGGNDGEADDTADQDLMYMESPPHRDNMLSPAMSVAGIGVACFHNALGWGITTDEEFAAVPSDTGAAERGIISAGYPQVFVQDPIVAAAGAETDSPSTMTAQQICDPGAATTSSTSSSTTTTTSPTTAPAAPLPAATYRLITSDGSVVSFTSPSSRTPTSGNALSEVATATPTPDGKGLWEATPTGAVYAIGDAPTLSPAQLTAGERVVGMAATSTGAGYWLATSDGGIYAQGDAVSFGSMAGTALNKPIVGMAATPDARGYWLVASDGGIFTFGDAGFYGSTGAMRLNQPIVGMSATPDGKGYWLVAADGGIFTFGDAPFEGSTGGGSLGAPVVGMVG